MHLRVDGKEFAAEVDLRASTIRWGESTFPIKVNPGSGGKIEVEIAGELATVDGWPEGLPTPLDSLAVNGERVALEVQEVERSTALSSSRPVHTAAGAAPERTAPVARSAVDPSGGTPIIPPMPGKVIEVRVNEGQQVHQGEVLLVLEAMKMRNEIQSPVDGVVAGLAVKAGENAPARQPLLFVRPSSSPSMPPS